MNTTVCLCMIVKDEAHVIERCVRSVTPFIDTWCIVDTGSTDGTQDLIRSVLKSVPGQLHERPWRNFGHNRTESIELASGLADYLFFIDADEVMELPPDYRRPELGADGYMLQMVLGTQEYGRLALVSTRLRWRSVGVLHEYLEADRRYRRETLAGPRVVVFGDGGRSQGVTMAEKYRRDAEILEAALIQEPQNTRYAFYLAQSYRDSGQKEKAIAAYQKRASMHGWDEEVWFSMFEVAHLTELTGGEAALVSDLYLKAYQFRPTRAEPLVHLARFHRLREAHALAHLYAERAVKIPRPSDILFLDAAIYNWMAKDEYAIACYWTGRFEDSKRACEELLASSNLPTGERDRVEQNLEFALSKLRVNGS